MNRDAESGGSIRVDALVVNEHHRLRRNSELGGNFKVDRGLGLQRIHLGADEDALEIPAGGGEAKRATEIETGVGENCEARSAVREFGYQLDSRRLGSDPGAKVDRPEVVDLGGAPRHPDVARDLLPVVGDAKSPSVESVTMPVVGGPEPIPGNSGGFDERSSIGGGRDRGDDLPVIEDDNTTGDSESHDTQTIVRRMAIHSSAIHLRYTKWTSRDAAAHIAVPKEDDDKYSRGVLGIITGSTEYPGAAVLGVEAALRTGVGMVRYLGPPRASDLVLARRPETVTANGRVQAWLIGSGMDAVIGGGESTAAMKDAVGQAVPIILDGGALDLHSSAKGPTVITPHFRELARLIGGDVEAIANDPATAAAKAADTLGITVLLKGHTTYVAAPDGTRLMTTSGPTWLATAGSGDALGGVLGALVATHASEIAADHGDLARLAATAAVIHGLAGKRASKGGPITILDLTGALPAVIASLLES